MEVYLNGEVPVQFPDDANEQDIQSFFQGQQMRGGGVWDNAFQLAGQLNQPQAPTVAGQFPVFGNAVGLNQEQFEGLNRTFQGVGQQQLQQQAQAQQQEQFNASQAMAQRAQTQRELQSEKDRAQELKLEQQRDKNRREQDKIRFEREKALEDAKYEREQKEEKRKLQQGTVASGVGGQQLVRRINPETGQWEVIPLNAPVFAPRGRGRGGSGSTGATPGIPDGYVEMYTPQLGKHWFNPETRDTIMSGGGADAEQEGYHRVSRTFNDGMKSVPMDDFGNLLIDGRWVDLEEQQASGSGSMSAAESAAAAGEDSGSGFSLNPFNYGPPRLPEVQQPVYDKPAMKGLKHGQAVDGMKYIGGDPNDPASWEKF